jgi:twinkle protein
LKEPAPGYVRHCINQLSDKLWLFDLVGTAKTERMLEVFRYAARRYQINHFIVDSLAKCGLGEDDYNGQKAMVESLVDFAHQHNVHVHLVSHARKSSDENTPPGKMDVKGTGAITDLVDNVIVVWRNKPKEARAAQAEADNRQLDLEQQDKPDAALIVSKQRHGESWEGEIWLWYHQDSMQYLERRQQRPAVYVEYMGGEHERTD